MWNLGVQFRFPKKLRGNAPPSVLGSWNLARIDFDSQIKPRDDSLVGLEWMWCCGM